MKTMYAVGAGGSGGGSRGARRSRSLLRRIGRALRGGAGAIRARLSGFRRR